ncbi:MAG: hypothetical protein KF763_11655 [Cyclobacteriaceae bacterium]|nr:hypothetical protein [Cyclobacteriaceae bacterium]
MKRYFYFISILFLPILIFGQSPNGQCYDKAYNVTDILPVLRTSPERILEAIKKEIIIPNELMDSISVLGIGYVINCKSEIVNIRLIKFADSEGKIIKSPFEIFVPKIKEILKRELKWTAAINGDKEVDFYQIFQISFRKGKITISLTAT